MFVNNESSKGGIYFFQSAMLKKKKEEARTIFNRLFREGEETCDLSLWNVAETVALNWVSVIIKSNSKQPKPDWEYIIYI